MHLIVFTSDYNSNFRWNIILLGSFDDKSKQLSPLETNLFIKLNITHIIFINKYFRTCGETSRNFIESDSNNGFFYIVSHLKKKKVSS